MASKLARQAVQEVAAKDRLFDGRARTFYYEICRCLPFIQRLHKLEEMVSVRELRAIVKAKFADFNGVKDGRVVDMLIFKGREELETYLLMHKQRHHAITEVIEPFYIKQRSRAKASPNSAFLDSFLSSGYQVKP